MFIDVYACVHVCPCVCEAGNMCSLHVCMYVCMYMYVLTWGVCVGPWLFALPLVGVVKV